MTLDPNLYTTNNGNTPQGQQVNQTDQILANAQPVNVANIADATPEQLNTALNQDVSKQAAINSPQFRSAYMGNSDLPAMQTNFSDLARQLFEYDKMNLAPIYSNNPGTPSDVPSYGRVAPSALQQLTPEAASGPTTLFADNPKYAVASNVAQRGNINDLLKNLNEAITKEFTSRQGTYASSAKSLQSAIDSIMGFKSLAQEKTLREEQMANERNIAAANNANARIVEGIKLGTIDPATGRAWETGVSKNKSNPTTPQDYADSFMGGYTRWADVPDSIKPAVTNLVKKQGGNVQKIIDGYNSLDVSSTLVNSIADKWNSMGDIEKHLPSEVVNLMPALSPTRAALKTTFINSLEPQLRAAVAGGRITQAEFQWIQDSIIPKATDSYESAMAKIKAVQQSLALKRTNPQYIIGSGDSQQGSTGGQGGKTRFKSPSGKVYELDSNSPEVDKLKGMGWTQQ